MSIPRPLPQDLRRIASEFGFTLSEADLSEAMPLLEESFAAYDLVSELELPVPPCRWPRGPVVWPQENPLGAWYVQCETKGAPEGRLQGKRIVLKDNILMAGVPMANGSATLAGFVPAEDATVVTRVLEAGGTITGKAVCENFCMTGGSHSAATGPVHNPHRHGYSSGGSSSGCAALLAAGQADMAVGGDQGGSIRIPSSFCGLIGMKPTHGLVPYSGIMPIEATIDHAGPMTRDLHDNALLLQVLAGADGLDPRQQEVRTDDYPAGLARGPAGLRIGLLAEGFGLPGTDPAVAALVQEAAEGLAGQGAETFTVSVPEHLQASSIWTTVVLEGLIRQMMEGNAMGFNWRGRYDVDLMRAHMGWRQRAGELPVVLKLSMLAGQWGLHLGGGTYYAKAQNLARAMRGAYLRCLEKVDVLVMPTTPCTALPLPAADAPLAEIWDRGMRMNASTAPFDITGLPALSVPCGRIDGLPVGMMLVGRPWAEATLYAAAAGIGAMGLYRP
ncbi:amidase [Pseudogemmobacter humi]|uniref:Amidase n=1 Tax=Pseudogemmobacter humi TaxID=2483812 RepID=A0A3P5XJZ1_9RHOB|nr:amidase [Pseudogemmobacter humi]VDC30494.1 Amidase [Pseudogemmobacter humi]